METFFNKDKSEVILKDEALRIFMSVLDTGNATVKRSLAVQLCFMSQSALATVIWANCFPGHFGFQT